MLLFHICSSRAADAISASYSLFISLLHDSSIRNAWSSSDILFESFWCCSLDFDICIMHMSSIIVHEHIHPSPYSLQASSWHVFSSYTLFCLHISLGSFCGCTRHLLVLAHTCPVLIWVKTIGTLDTLGEFIMCTVHCYVYVHVGSVSIIHSSWYLIFKYEQYYLTLEISLYMYAHMDMGPH